MISVGVGDNNGRHETQTDVRACRAGITVHDRVDDAMSISSAKMFLADRTATVTA